MIGQTTTTFAVSDVAPATEPLAELPYRQAVSEFLCGPVESSSEYSGHLVANVVSHPLIAALHGSFASHRPLCLSPDIIWLTITQGLAIHVNQNAEQLRQRLVSHDGKLKISVSRDDFVKGAPDNPWPEVFSEFSRAIREHLGPTHDLIVANFSTTGPVEHAASEVVLLDAMQAYFVYELQTICGIPSITLEGTVDDWRSIAHRIERFRELDLEWWVDPLQSVLQQFVNAAAGLIDREFWESIYKYRGPEGSGSSSLTGWVVKLFPYVRSRNFLDETIRYARNPWLGGPRTLAPTRENFPNLPAKAPFKWRFPLTTYDMEFIGGLIGVSQDRDSLCLRPEVGWAIRDLTPKEAPAARAARFDDPSNWSSML